MYFPLAVVQIGCLVFSPPTWLDRLILPEENEHKVLFVLLLIVFTSFLDRILQ